MNEILHHILDLLKNGGEYNINREIKTLSELFGIFGGNESFNLIPSEGKSRCCEIAIFISLTKSIPGLKLKQDQFIPLEIILPKVIQQVQGTCSGINKIVNILCDEINTNSFEPWIDNLRTIKKQSKEFSIYYIGGRKIENITDIIL